MLRILVHLLGALQFTYSVYYDWNYVEVPPGVLSNGISFGGKFVYLTFWDAIVQSVFFWICLINDFIGTNEIQPKRPVFIKKFKDLFYCSIAFPLSAVSGQELITIIQFVAVTFWGLYAVDRELVLPKVLDNYFPTWLNHVMHTNIFIFSLIELVTTCRVYPNKKKGLTILASFMLVYLIWVLIIYSKSGAWVYPVLEVLNWPARIVFILSLLFLVQAFYLIGEFLNKIVWGQELKSIMEGSKRSKKAY